jgi:hypothetical protein
MRGILYFRNENPSGRELLDLITPLFQEHLLSCHQSVADLSIHLRKRVGNEGIVILLLDSLEDLEAILQLRGLFWKYRILLILPDMERSTVARAVQLSPRFMTSADQGLGSIREVLVRLLDPVNDEDAQGRTSVTLDGKRHRQ